MNINIKEVKFSGRILYFDYLRILATFAVIFLHVSAQNWYSVGINSFEWNVFNILESAVRWAVPIFVMISGGIFLDNDRKISISKIYKVNIFTKITSFVFWMYIYVTYRFMIGNTLTMLSTLQGQYHMWFIYMLIGLYILIPILRKITESKKLTEYFLKVVFIFSFLVPSLINILRCFSNVFVLEFINAFDGLFVNFNFLSNLGYVFYFILGFYLYKFDIKVKYRKIIYILGLIGYILTFLFTYLYSNNVGEVSDIFYSNSSINVLFMSFSVFIFGKYTLSKIVFKDKWNGLLLKFSNLTYGIYLVHILIMDCLSDILGLNTLSFNPFISVIIITLIVTIISFGISFLMNLVPFLRKYIV